MRRKFKMRAAVTAVSAICFLSGLFTPVAHAYLTDITERMSNSFTVALDSETSTIEKFPDPNPKPDSNNAISYEKRVQVANTGDIDAWVRVRIEFTDSDIRNKTQLTNGNGYYSVSEYLTSHLPSGWRYNASDGYCYYTSVLPAGDWDSLQDKLTYSKETNTWYYNGNSVVEPGGGGTILTTPLFTQVRTTFNSPADIRSYGITAHTESCPFYLGNDYSSAWASYDAGNQ